MEQVPPENLMQKFKSKRDLYTLLKIDGKFIRTIHYSRAPPTTLWQMFNTLFERPPTKEKESNNHLMRSQIGLQAIRNQNSSSSKVQITIYKENMGLCKRNWRVNGFLPKLYRKSATR